MLKEGCVKACPGCAHRMLSMDESLQMKEQWLKTKLALWQETIQPIRSVSEDKRWYYRGKVCLNTKFQNDSWQFGMYHRDELIDIPLCPIHSPMVRKTIGLLKNVLPPNDVFPMAFYYHSEEQLTLILKTKKVPDISWLTGNVKAELDKIGIKGLSIHLNPSAGRRLFEKQGWHLLWGKDKSNDKAGYVYGRTSFHQLIQFLYQQSLDEAEVFFQPEVTTAIIDLYCGRGISMARWNRHNSQIIGIETGGEAVTCAKINIPEALILQGTCERRIPQLEHWRAERCLKDGILKFCLYTNPPRTGMEQKVTEWVTGSLKPEKIAYLSCSAGTLKRDLEILTSNGYIVKTIIPFDFFPQTYHVECLALLQLPQL